MKNINDVKIKKGLVDQMAEFLVRFTTESQHYVSLVVSKLLKTKGYGAFTLFWCILIFFVAVLAARFYDRFVPRKCWERLFFFSRLQRHDFNNHLQVIYAMLQLGKVDKVLDYIEKIKRKNEIFSAVCSLENPRLIGEVLDLIILLKKKGYDIYIKEPVDFDLKKVNLQDVKYLKKKIWKVLKEGKDLQKNSNLQNVFPEALVICDSKPDIV
ncbi:Sensor_kinase_SpoOB-type, alpha-helical domain [Caldanaerovirga acetigignens]|uniref:Sensor_kinase_SpoOB-type, alpha-helical domain n=1 Tax=Caldanaerovirga acetigignens TaxID=447595 RepID=A0A1M7K8Z6_9FIRM|nr:Spo0B domain-containing protein [Caldanaerovirga acetigignens]SHM61769.1 Sensor_kinase_SpoOB-type, alpha-helical domain [Caldanaerovirga acetigignens]